MEKIKHLLELCKNHPVLIQMHNFPDPDALASGFGLQRLLKECGIEAVLCYDGELDKRACKKMIESFQIHAVPLKELGEISYDTFLICVDTQKAAGNITPLCVEIRAVIDHHPTFAPTSYDYQDLREVGSCSTMIADYFRRLHIIPDHTTANVLNYGIKMDTLHFSRGVKDLDIEMFQFLNQYGNVEELKKLADSKMLFTDLKAYSSAIDSFQAYGTMGIAEIEFPCSNDLIAMISDFFLGLDEIDMAVVYSRREDGIKFSVRSKKTEIDAGEWIKEAIKNYGTGGGHSYMAGGLIETENIKKLGPFPSETIRNLFLSAKWRIKKAQKQENDAKLSESI